MNQAFMTFWMIWVTLVILTLAVRMIASSLIQEDIEMIIKFEIPEKLIKKVCKEMEVDLAEGKEMIKSWYCEMDEDIMEEALEDLLNY